MAESKLPPHKAQPKVSYNLGLRITLKYMLDRTNAEDNAYLMEVHNLLKDAIEGGGPSASPPRTLHLSRHITVSDVLIPLKLIVTPREFYVPPFAWAHTVPDWRGNNNLDDIEVELLVVDRNRKSNES